MRSNLCSPPPQRFNEKEQTNLAIPTQELDFLLAQLSESVRVDVMPGETDPANYTLPQQPFPKCLFPRSSQTQKFRSVTNPFQCEIDNRVYVHSVFAIEI
jgi:DNA polymerase delta subunit 2